MTKEEILKQVAALKAEFQELWNDIDEHSKEEERVAVVLHNAESIMDKLDSTFEKRTALTAADTTILMIATALQVMRIYLLSKFQEKIKDEDRLAHNDPSIKEKVKEQMQKYKEEHSNWKSKKSQKSYRSWQEIAFTIKVPYDASVVCRFRRLILSTIIAHCKTTFLGGHCSCGKRSTPSNIIPTSACFLANPKISFHSFSESVWDN